MGLGRHTWFIQQLNQGAHERQISTGDLGPSRKVCTKSGGHGTPWRAVTLEVVPPHCQPPQHFKGRSMKTSWERITDEAFKSWLLQAMTIDEYK